MDNIQLYHIDNEINKIDEMKEGDVIYKKGMGLCSECGRLTTSHDGRDVVVPGKWHGKFPKEKATEEQLKKVGYKKFDKMNKTNKAIEYTEEKHTWLSRR